MDVVIPSHGVKTFCSSLASLTKMGSDIYWEFDVVRGLTLRTINDAKSAYSCWHYEAKFFERCTVPPPIRGSNGNRRKAHANSQTTQSYFTGRMCTRSLQPLLRSRKAASLRITTPHVDSDAVSFAFSMEFGDSVITIQYDIPLTTQTETLCAVPDMEDASTFCIAPSMLGRLLDALTTSYAALIIRNGSSVAASSFSNGEVEALEEFGTGTRSTNDCKGLKSETGCDVQELLDFDYVNRDTLEEGIPDDVNEEVILVFHLPEAKSFLQFANSLEAIYISFHWGGKPALLETKAETFSARLVLATLDHSSLKANRTMQGAT